VSNCITSKLINWVLEVFGDGVVQYFYAVGEEEARSDPRHRKNDMEVYKKTDVYKFLQTLVLNDCNCSEWEKAAYGLLQLRRISRP
jgi:hypothetical protein